MDIKSLGRTLGIIDNLKVVRKAAELQRLSNVHFDSSTFGVGEVCKSVLCLELACTSSQVPFDRQKAVRVSGMSEKAYIRSLTNLQNALGLRPNLDVRELAVQFGCVRMIGSVHKTLSLYKQRFVAALPESRRCNADFGRPIFTAVAFYLCSRKNKLKVDKCRLLEICGACDAEFASVASSMSDLCFDMVGVEKEKKDPKFVKCNRELLDALPAKRRHEEELSESDNESVDDDDGLEVPGLNRPKKLSKVAYEEWKASVISARETLNTISGCIKRTKQVTLPFAKKSLTSVKSLPIS